MKLFHEQFSSLAQANPAKTALSDARGSLTYAQVNGASNALASLLVQRGLKPGQPVAVFVSRQKEVMVAALAILKAGGVYLPFDEQYPNERLTYMLNDANAHIVLADSKLCASRKPNFEGREVIFVDKVNSLDNFNFVPRTHKDAAMILYTSGTTGNPKGVIHAHALLCHINDWTENHEGLAFDSTAHMAIMSGFTFVASNAFMFGVLLAGGTLHIAPAEVKFGTDILYSYLKENGITHVFMPSSLACTMIEDFDMTGTAIFAGGEKLRNFKPLSKGAKLLNFYGSTELATMFSIRVLGNETPVPIGHLTPGVKACLVDENLKPVPGGEVGELLVHDAWLSAGYLNLPKLTAEKWVEIEGSTYFRTGDRMRKGANGCFYILGRMDNMVKLRGFRIETGEVETQVSNAMQSLNYEPSEVVVVLRTVNGADHLCCYYEHKRALDTKKIAHAIKQFLPDYMVPDLWVNVPEMKRNINGKVVRDALPQPKLPVHLLGATASEVELRVVECAGLVLGLEGAIDPTDSFVSLGGSSLSAMELASALGEQGISVSGTKILSSDSLREVAAAAKVKYERLWSVSEFEAVKARFASRGETIESVLPLSPQQDDLICYHFAHPDFNALERSFLFATQSQLSQNNLRTVLDEMSKLHPRMRASVVCTGVSVFQSVITNKEIPLKVIDRCESDFASVKAILDAETNSSIFDLERSPMFRVVVVNRKNGGSWLFVVVNKIAYDIKLLRQMFAQMMNLLLEFYPADVEISSWAQLLSNAVEADKESEPSASCNHTDFQLKENKGDVCVYSHEPAKKMFFVHTGNTGAAAYFPLAQRIKNDYSLTVFEPYNLYHTDDIQHGIPAIAAKYIEIMKQHQACGPYVLGGWCYGGVVAHEMACQLQAAGEVVQHLIMLDSHCLADAKSKKLAAPMQAGTNRRYFETCPLFKELRENGMLEAVIKNAERVVSDTNAHVPKSFLGSLTYFKPSRTPASATGDVLKYWSEMMKLKAGNYEKYCDPNKLEVVVVPGEHDEMMLDAALDVIVPKIYEVV